MAAAFPTTPVDIIGFYTHTQKNHTPSCSKKITGEAMSLRWQSSTMCSSSLSSCCTSWTWCSFQPCPVGNQPVFSLAVCLCVRVMLSSYAVPSFQQHKLPCPRASSVDWPQRLCVACSDECYPDSLPECHRCNPLSMSVGQRRGCQEGATFHISCSTSFPFLSVFVFSSLILALKRQTKQVSAWKQCDVFAAPSLSFTDKFFRLFQCLLPFFFCLPCQSSGFSLYLWYTV